MISTRCIIIFLALAVLSGYANGHISGESHSLDVKIIDLGSGIFELRTDQAGNVAVLIGEDGVFMVDTQMENLVESIDKAQKRLSDSRDVDLVLNTHFHRDHVRGNAYFKSRGAIIMAHPNVRRYIENPKAIKQLGRTAPSFTHQYLPTIDVTEDTSIHINGQSIDLYHTHNAHTNSDLFVVFREANVIHAGDLVYTQRFPFIDIDNGGSVEGYIAGIKSIIEVANKDTRVIAGHGPTATIDDLKATISMLVDTHEIVAKLIADGLFLDEILALEPLEGFSDKWSWGFITADRMIVTHYYDITGKLK
ncbi:MBL fold metallo-hydrolase [Planctobacterium marinum]|uniref:MBL fold metallo-hydrolase n=1 Tax=Planctobacterium marinum TaxID=1631968 RepID=UPI001E5C4C65|nr:MBL fold metallo-hydrolase [Planctobacterium marinum]MCC2605749.1 MBL fold metallo-hydrolase [Planctobacterium marinum]